MANERRAERAAIVRRARSLIGVRFRPQGRSRAQGLDCIGVVMMATRTPRRRVREDYGLLAGEIGEVNAGFDDVGFIRLPPDRAGPGDILIVDSGPRQLHAVILTDEGYLHAHAGLRKVVETPGAVPWPVLSAWRHPDEYEPPLLPRSRRH